MRLPELIVVEKPWLDELRGRSRLWWLGWLTAAGFLLAAVVVLTWSTELLYRLQRLQDRAELLQAQQQETEAATIRQWEQQQLAISTITSWGQYVRDRAEIRTENGPGLPHAPMRVRPRPLTFSTGPAMESP